MRSTYLRLVRGAEDLRAGGALARFSKADLVSGPRRSTAVGGEAFVGREG